MSDQGPIYLGYRLGHVKGDGRIFRALVYNKGASVLHMLRRMLGDDVFFRSLRRFYADRHFAEGGHGRPEEGVRAGIGPLARDILRWLDHGPGSAHAFRIAHHRRRRILRRRPPRTVRRAHVRVPGDCVVDLRGWFSRRRGRDCGSRRRSRRRCRSRSGCEGRGESGSDHARERGEELRTRDEGRRDEGTSLVLSSPTADRSQPPASCRCVRTARTRARIAYHGARRTG